MPASHEPETVVQSLFHAFRDGDLEGLLATLHDDVSLTYVGANPSIAAGPLVEYNVEILPRRADDQSEAL